MATQGFNLMDDDWRRQLASGGITSSLGQPMSTGGLMTGYVGGARNADGTNAGARFIERGQQPKVNPMEMPRPLSGVGYTGREHERFAPTLVSDPMRPRGTLSSGGLNGGALMDGPSSRAIRIMTFGPRKRGDTDYMARRMWAERRDGIDGSRDPIGRPAANSVQSLAWNRGQQERYVGARDKLELGRIMDDRAMTRQRRIMDLPYEAAGMSPEEAMGERRSVMESDRNRRNWMDADFRRRAERGAMEHRDWMGTRRADENAAAELERIMEPGVQVSRGVGTGVYSPESVDRAFDVMETPVGFRQRMGGRVGVDEVFSALNPQPLIQQVKLMNDDLAVVSPKTGNFSIRNGRDRKPSGDPPRLYQDEATGTVWAQGPDGKLSQARLPRDEVSNQEFLAGLQIEQAQNSLDAGEKGADKLLASRKRAFKNTFGFEYGQRGNRGGGGSAAPKAEGGAGVKPAKAVDTGSPKVEVPKGAPTPKLYSFNEDGAIVFDPKADLRQVLSQAVNDRVVSREHALAFMEAQGYKVKR